MAIPSDMGMGHTKLPSEKSVLYFDHHHFIFFQFQHIVVCFQWLQFPVLILSEHARHMLPGAAPLPRAPNNQRVIEVIIVCNLYSFRLCMYEYVVEGQWAVNTCTIHQFPHFQRH